jgi:hypothetical protein
MSNLTQQQLATFKSPMLAQTTMDPQPATVSAQILPTSTAPVICAGCSVMLAGVAGPNIVVDVPQNVQTGPVYGVICYSLRKNRYVAGDTVEVASEGNILMLESSGAITRGARVTCLNPTVNTNDPVVYASTTQGDQSLGVALGQASGSGQLIKVLIKPALFSTYDLATVAP